ncbi:hypothetical protein [Geodermatophilus sp. SYSU D01105]
MTSAIMVVVAILLGLPLLAWWLGNRRFWSRLRPGAERDPWGDAMRRFGLTPQDAARVESAVTWGRRMDDERLRRAAVAWARDLIEQAEARRRIRSPWGRVAVLLGWAGVVAAGLYWVTVREGGVPWDAVAWWLFWPAVFAWLVGGPRRAIRVNSDSRSPDDRHGAP